MEAGIYEQLVEMAQRWRLGDLRGEVANVVAELDESDRPYVPSQLLRSLDMFLDSYGPQGWNAQNER
ncbi:MAG: hypothetical protein ACRDWT_08935 [Jatrophihabitantaceae bacterium]